MRKTQVTIESSHYPEDGCVLLMLVDAAGFTYAASTVPNVEEEVNQEVDKMIDYAKHRNLAITNTISAAAVLELV